MYMYVFEARVNVFGFVFKEEEKYNKYKLVVMNTPPDHAHSAANDQVIECFPMCPQYHSLNGSFVARSCHHPPLNPTFRKEYY